MITSSIDRVRRTRIVDGVARFLRLSSPGRGIAVRDTDLFVTSYPRSGNTWMRFLLAAIRDPGRVPTYPTVQNLLPDIYKVSARKIDASPAPRWLKSHEYFDPRYRNVLYLVRDPRSVTVSYFHYQSRFGILPADATIPSFVRSFIKGEVDGLGTWGEHVLSWIGPREASSTFLLVRYEDLVDHPLQELARVANWLHLDASQEAMEKALTHASIEQMKRLESGQLSSRSFGRDTPELTYIREGKTNAWKEELDEDSERLITSAFATAMSKVGYLEAGS